MKHVHFIRGRYVVRVTVPEDLREIIGKRELAESLGCNKRTAERMAQALSPKPASFVKDNNERVAQSQQRIADEAFNASVTAQQIGLALRKATKRDLHRIVRNAVTEETA